jgi:RimJ/RimL family protein N-acetyltransferase
MADWAEVEIAATTPEHLDGFHRAFDSVARERVYLTFLEAPPLSETREYALGLLRAGNPHFVALAEGEVVGWCDIARFRRPTEAHRGRLGMGIVAAYRSRGVGRRLIEAALRRAREIRLTRIELDAYADNSRAITLYERVGFVREGVIRDAICVDGVYRDAIGMGLILRDRGAAGG